MEHISDKPSGYCLIGLPVAAPAFVTSSSSGSIVTLLLRLLAGLALWLLVDPGSARAQTPAGTITPSAASLSGAWVNVNDSVTFTASGGASNAAYTWSGAVSGSGSSVLHAFTAPGTYTVTLSDANNPSTTAPVSFTLQVSALVNISSTTFSSASLPFVSTSQPLATTYKLRAKFVSGGTTVQAANQPNANAVVLDSPPPSGTYTLYLYWVQYDTAGVNVLQIGPMQSMPSTVLGTTAQTAAPPVITLSAATLSGNWVNVGDPVTFTASFDQQNSQTPTSSGGFVWSGAVSGTGTSVTEAFTTPGVYNVTLTNVGDTTYAPATVSMSVNVSALVSLSSTTFSAANPPTISTTQSLSSTFKLRAKFNSGSTSVQAANQPNVNPAVLDTMPPPGSYTLYLYWVQYDPTGTTLQQIGPTQTMPATVTGTTSQSAVSCGLSAASLSGQWVNVGDPVTFTASGGTGSGGYVWSGAVSSTASSVTQSFAAPGTYTINLYRAGDTTYATSAVVTTILHVSALLNLSSLSFQNGSPPTLSTSQPLQSTFELRAKFYNSNLTQQAANQKNVNPVVLDTLPPPGPYTVALYWLQYDETGQNILQFGPTQTITVTINQSPPVITSPSTAGGATGNAFNYQITALNGPISSYGASGLPPGLSVNTTSGAITGTPTGNGQYTATISASNSGATTTASVAITIAATGPSGVPPAVLQQLGVPTSAQADSSNSEGLQVLLPQSP